ncbi:hypothetical protein TNCV_3317711 [Trichonephila clavipes]|nr:hypothetical protein TNCV_3317711 [Trichonephila clavipes]
MLYSWCVRPGAVHFIRALRYPTLQQDNARPHFTKIVWTFLDTENVQLSPWTTHSPDILPLENVWSMVAERLARHLTAASTVDEL